MLTTTPRFKPRDGCEPMPMTSSSPASLSSPTSATTLDVPMSSPTMRLRSLRLGILIPFPIHWRFIERCRSRGRRALRAPADGVTVRVAHVEKRDVILAFRHLWHESGDRKAAAPRATHDSLYSERGDAVEAADHLDQARRPVEREADHRSERPDRGDHERERPGPRPVDVRQPPAAQLLGARPVL